MAWEYDSTGGGVPLSIQQGQRRRLVVWLLLGILLGSTGVLIMRHKYYPPMPLPQQSNVTPGPPAPPGISTPSAVSPSMLEGAIVRLTSATFAIPLTDSLPQLPAGRVPLVAPPATYWRLIIPARQSAYYDLRIDLDAPLTAAPQAGQVYLWYRAGQTATALPGPTVSLAMQADYLIITIHGPELKQMFLARPPVVTIEPSAAGALRTLVVSYSDL